jgi:DNA (cytosine-5)-methyltransferase 1
MEELIFSIKKLTFSLEGKSTYNLSFVDLFCGIGGFHLAMKNIREIKSKCILSCDIDKSVRETYKLNFNIEPEDDIKKLDMTKYSHFDILFGGFPCQPYSYAGKRLGLDDIRGTLLYDTMKIIKDCKPIFCILENVKGIKTVNNGFVFQQIKDISNEIGYFSINILTNPITIGVPQVRERYVFILVRKDFYTTNIETIILNNYYNLVEKKNRKIRIVLCSNNI